MSVFDAQFNLRKRHPSGKFHLLLNVMQSHLARLSLKHSRDIAYGDSPGQKLDIFPAKQQDAPVLVFIHGGYFRALDKGQYSYMARPFVAAGYTVVLVNYDLAPAVTVSTIVEQNLRAFDWITQNVQRWNGDPEKITLCGHSVGAFLVVKILQQLRNPRQIQGAVLLSGLYDLTRIKQSYLNADLHLSDADVRDLSPMLAGNISLPAHMPEVLVAVGNQETEEFIQQSENYAVKLQRAGVKQAYMLLPDKNHYTVSRMLVNKRNPLMQRILQLGKNCSVAG